MLCPNYQLAPLKNGAAPTINIFILTVGAKMLIVGVAPFVNGTC